MIRSFGNTLTEKIYRGIRDKEVSKFPPEVLKIAMRKLDMIGYANKVEDLKAPPGNRLEKKVGKLRDYWAIRINDQWRVVFKWESDGPHEVTITD